jgi:hypothetical protein
VTEAPREFTPGTADTFSNQNYYESIEIWFNHKINKQYNSRQMSSLLIRLLFLLFSVQSAFPPIPFCSLCDIFRKGKFLVFYVLDSTLLHLPPLRFPCVGDAGIEPRTVATLALAVRRSNNSARSHPH